MVVVDAADQHSRPGGGERDRVAEVPPALFAGAGEPLGDPAARTLDSEDPCRALAVIEPRRSDQCDLAVARERDVRAEPAAGAAELRAPGPHAATALVEQPD